jgi:hypothetical protein
MRLYIILVGLFFILDSTFAQQPKYQTFKSKMSLIGEKDAEKFQFDNDKITVALDYKTGSFISRLKNTDFKIDKNYATDKEQIEEEEIVLEGILPIEAMIDQKAIRANYKTELKLTTPDDVFILHFDIEVNKPGSKNKGYRIFMMRGIIYNDETNFPAFEGFDNEIAIILTFNAFWNN